MMAVYLIHTEINTRKLNPNKIMSPKMPSRLVGGVLSSANAPIDNASPNTISDMVSMRGVGSEYLLFDGKTVRTTTHSKTMIDRSRLPSFSLTCFSDKCFPSKVKPNNHHLNLRSMIECNGTRRNQKYSMKEALKGAKMEAK